MQPQFQSSFIPKKPVTDSAKVLGSTRKSRNIISSLASLIFVLTIMAAGGLFVYEKFVDRQITDANKAIDDARVAFEADKIQDLINTSTRFTTIKELLDKHLAVSEILILLQELTLKNIKFDDFAFQNKSNERNISMTGEATSYNTVAKQSEVIKASGLVSAVAFSNFTLSDKGAVRFKFSGTVAPSLISYKQALNAVSSIEAEETATTVEEEI